jgi:hypothetical protein
MPVAAACLLASIEQAVLLSPQLLSLPRLKIRRASLATLAGQQTNASTLWKATHCTAAMCRCCVQRHRAQSLAGGHHLSSLRRWASAKRLAVHGVSNSWTLLALSWQPLIHGTSMRPLEL